ncbi:zinc ribbon domain-containing protein [Patescibacteria group bacterium]|nr:zinc ribbon domain-containing protein [Patescibacteria group bacterium]MCG2699935.1 zinc ribbon domain-containing protein [Candidatus Parcubacteria bacterium]
MFCEKCGNEIKENHKFCTECGHSNSTEATPKVIVTPNHLDQKWWYRLAKVFYVVLYIPLPFLIILVWGENSSSYNYYSKTYTDTIGDAFWYSLLTSAIYIVVLRLIKITFLYVSLAQKPHWKKEFKKFF